MIERTLTNPLLYSNTMSMKKSAVKTVISKKSASSVLKVTESAVQKIRELRKNAKKEKFGLRIEVIPGGCAGMKYWMDFEEKPSKEDSVIAVDDVSIHVDPTSAEFLKGTTLDYVESLEASGFAFQNPNVTHSCHCGKSVC